MSNLTKLAISIGATLLAGTIGSLFTAPAVTGWYEILEKPALNPPSWVFGPVWTILYVLMGVAVFLIWKKGTDRRGVKIALWAFAVQLSFNVAWSAIFFGLKNPGLALVEIIILWLAIVWMILTFSKVSKAATYLVLPYLLWVSFATYLNYAIWVLN